MSHKKKSSLQELAIQTLDANRHAKKTKYTPPSPDHYPNGYLWDSDFVAIVYAQLSEPKKAMQELQQVLSWQNVKTGFIPNMKLGRGRNFDLERFTFKKPHISSDYTQPPYHARAAWEIYKSAGRKNGLEFLKKNYHELSLSYKYFISSRESRNSHLVGIIHPHETGRDSDPTFDFIKLRIPTVGLRTPIAVQYTNSVLDYASALFLNVKLRSLRWNVSKIKKGKNFWVIDIMFNCIYANNLEIMSKIAKLLGKRRDAKLFSTKSRQVEREIIDRLWDKKDEMFYAINRDGKFIKTVSISNLAPLMLSSIKPFQVEKLLGLLEDKKWFNTPYPIPSVPANSNMFDPHYRELRLWRGTTWINTNWMINEALLKQADRFKMRKLEFSKRLKNRSDIISQKTIQLGKSGFWEFYDSLTGQGLRIKSFAWSTLAAVIQKRYLERTA